jgi:hypothetical protein
MKCIHYFAGLCKETEKYKTVTQKIKQPHRVVPEQNYEIHLRGIEDGIHADIERIKNRL